MKKESSVCGIPCFTSAAKLNHLVVSEKEIRISSAKEYKNTWCELFANIFCCRSPCCCGTRGTEDHKLFGPMTSDSVFAYDVNHVQLKTFDVLKRKSSVCNILNWFTMLLLGTWQIICLNQFRITRYTSILKQNTMAMATLAPTYLLPGFIFILILLIDGFTQLRNRRKRLSMMAQLIKKAEEEETQKNTELQPMVQVQVPEGAKPGTKLSVQAANGSMVDIVVPANALPNTILQVAVPTPGKNEAQAAGSKEKKAEHKSYKCRFWTFCAAFGFLFGITGFQIAMLALAGPFANPMGWTVRHRAPGATRRRLYAHEIPPPEMFSGVYLHGPDHEVVLDIYKAHWDIQRRKVRAGHKRFLGGGNTTSEDTTLESTCKNAVFNVAEHMEDVTNCKCVDKDKNYFTCTEEDVPEEQEEEKKEKKETPGDPYICPEFSKYES